MCTNEIIILIFFIVVYGGFFDFVQYCYLLSEVVSKHNA